MARVGWNFGEEFAPGPAVVPMGSAWPATSSETMPSSEGQTRIGFVFDEVAGSPLPLESSAKAPVESYANNGDSPNPNLLHPADASARRASSFNVPKRPPPPRLHDFSSASCDVPGSEKPDLPEKSKSLAQSRSSSRSSAAYQQGLADMADLMTTVDLSESEKQKIRDRFALDK
ncbi:hypothetical protein TSMEX_011019 [Taenia solium]|eukprot:TsM_000687800 transcript=TsM_000687800 gene=TsM_000687800